MKNAYLLKPKTLTEDLVRQRLRWLALNTDAINELINHYPKIEPHLNTLVESFIQQATFHGLLTQNFIDNNLKVKALRHSIQLYLMELFSETLNSQTLNNSYRYELLHQQFYPSPQVYPYVLWLLKKIITDKIKNISDTPIPLVETLDKIFYFEITLFSDAYTHQLETKILDYEKKLEHCCENIEAQVAERTIELTKQAQIDALTNLYNQRAMRELAHRELKIAKRQKQVISLIYFDIDNFKQINDLQGHLKGDEVLQCLGTIIKDCIRETDIACRYGGDEFCLILKNCSEDCARELCHKLIARFQTTYPKQFLSFGVATTGPENYLDLNTLIDTADHHMYLAKKQNGFSIC